jgi:hypothetical protein
LVAHAKAVKEALTRKAVVSAAVAAVAEAAAVGTTTTTKATKAKANSMIDSRWSPPTSPTSARSGPPQFGATRGDADDEDDQDDEDDAPAVSRPYWSIITDGIHCHPQAVNFAYKAHPEGCVLVTDGALGVFTRVVGCNRMLISTAHLRCSPARSLARQPSN